MIFIHDAENSKCVLMRQFGRQSCRSERPPRGAQIFRYATLYPSTPISKQLLPVVSGGRDSQPLIHIQQRRCTLAVASGIFNGTSYGTSATPDTNGNDAGGFGAFSQTSKSADTGSSTGNTASIVRGVGGFGAIPGLFKTTQPTSSTTVPASPFGNSSTQAFGSPGIPKTAPPSSTNAAPFGGYVGAFPFGNSTANVPFGGGASFSGGGTDGVGAGAFSFGTPSPKVNVNATPWTPEANFFQASDPAASLLMNEDFQRTVPTC